jgi:hypothetical protein
MAMIKHRVYIIEFAAISNGISNYTRVLLSMPMVLAFAVLLLLPPLKPVLLADS